MKLDRKVTIAVALSLAAALLGACGGGGAPTSPGGASHGAVATSQIARKIGLVSNGAGEYRLAGCTAKRLFVAPAQIEEARAQGKLVVTDPTGRYGVEIERRGDCPAMIEGALASLNVP